MAVSIFSTRRTSASIVARERESSSAIAPRCRRHCPPNHLLEVAIRNHAEHGRVLDVDVRTECAGEPDAIDALDAEPLHEQPDARRECRLGELDRAYVVLRDAECLRALCSTYEYVRPRRRSRAARGERAVDDTVAADDAGEVELGDHFDDARAADAGDAGGGGRRGEPGSFDHRSEPMILKRGSSVSRSMRTRSIAPGAARWPH